MAENNFCEIFKNINTHTTNEHKHKKKQQKNNNQLSHNSQKPRTGKTKNVILFIFETKADFVDRCARLRSRESQCNFLRN